MHNKLNWNPHCIDILAKATVRFNLLRRTCHFVSNIAKKRTLYITLVRSLFEHGSVVWSPSCLKTIGKFEAFQKRCIKWILKEQFKSYERSEYIIKLKELDILPMKYKFLYTDLVLFHKIVHHLIPIDMPQYVETKCNTRASKSDTLIFKISSEIGNQKRVFYSNFFARCISPWNILPVELRHSNNSKLFTSGLKSYIWDCVIELPDNDLSFEFEPD